MRREAQQQQQHEEEPETFDVVRGRRLRRRDQLERGVEQRVAGQEKGTSQSTSTSATKRSKVGKAADGRVEEAGRPGRDAQGQGGYDLDKKTVFDRVQIVFG